MSFKYVKVKPKTKGQRQLLRELRKEANMITLVYGPTGTGKSLLVLAYAVDSIMEGKYSRLVIVKPIVDVKTGRELTVMELGEAHSRLIKSYLTDLLSPYMDKGEMEKLIDSGKIEFADTHYVRGRTFDNTLIFIDDAQNVPIESILEILSRIGLNSRLFIAADPIFQPAGGGEERLTELRDLMVAEEKVSIIELGLGDIVRPGARKAIKLLLEERMRKRKPTRDEEKVKNVVKKHAPDADVVTVVDLRSEKTRMLPATTPPLPDMLVIVKEGHHGRAIGKEGERIRKAEEELGLSLRVAEASLDLSQLIRPIHPAPWSLKHVEKIDIMGPNIVVKIKSGHAGPLLGQKGLYIKFVESIMRKLLGIGVIVREEE